MIYAIRTTDRGRTILDTVDNKLSLRHTVLLDASFEQGWHTWTDVSKRIDFVRDNIDPSVLETYTSNPLATYSSDVAALTRDVLALETKLLMEVARHRDAQGVYHKDAPSKPRRVPSVTFEYTPAIPHRVGLTNKGKEALEIGLISAKVTRAILEGAQYNKTVRELTRYVRTVRDTAFSDEKLSADIAELQSKGLIKVYQ